MRLNSNKKILILETDELFDSVEEAAKELGYHVTSLSSHINKRKLLAIGDFLTISIVKEFPRYCTDCGIFLMNNPISDGGYLCKKCASEATKRSRMKLRAKNPEEFLKNQRKIHRQWVKDQVAKDPDYHRRKSLMRSFNLSLEDYNKMSEAQNGLCAICGRHQIEFTRYLDVDHNHKTGKIRGLLCSRCNLAVGLFDIDNQGNNLLLKSIEYVKEYNG